ncbi:MFS transporter [Roseibium marinum]|uniref:Putative MFS family arabinose efflux permease n=1 Tax=Roseibium marinum TaxID=281252 RepID=A0A2S3UKI4_9HYPH|nr:MFS transporter [Roseibium marinum]POF28073.1 putative MFS family arabinose efflux permease [Roseibium marinum]
MSAVAEKGEGMPRRWAALAALYLAMFMNILDVSAVNLALPAIREGLHASATELEWVLVIYVLTFAAGLLPFGLFGDVIGRERVFMWGVAGFSLSSLACGLAADTGSLVASRAVQGLAAAMMVPQVLAIVHVIFPEEERGKAFGLFGTISALGAVAGPLVGGVIVSADIAGLGWRPIFLVNIPVGMFSLYGAWRFVPKIRAAERVTADWAGTIVFALAIAGFVFPLVEGRRFGWPLWCFALMALSAGLGGLFLKLQARRAAAGLAQLLPAALLSDPMFLRGLALVCAFFSGLAGVFFVLAIFLQSGLGLSPLAAGIALAPHPVGVMIGAYLSGRFASRTPDRRVAFGIFILFLGMVSVRLATVGTPLTGADFLLPLLSVGLGTGVTIAALFQSILSRVSSADAGAGSGVLQAFQQIGIALGIALQGQIFFQVLGPSPSLASSPAAYLAAVQAALLYPAGVFLALTLIAVISLKRRAGS